MNMFIFIIRRRWIGQEGIQNGLQAAVNGHFFWTSRNQEAAHFPWMVSIIIISTDIKSDFHFKVFTAVAVQSGCDWGSHDTRNHH